MKLMFSTALCLFSLVIVVCMYLYALRYYSSYVSKVTRSATAVGSSKSGSYDIMSSKAPLTGGSSIVDTTTRNTLHGTVLPSLAGERLESPRIGPLSNR